MPRQPDPELEGRILHAADVLWRRGASGDARHASLRRRLPLLRLLLALQSRRR